MAKKKDPYDFPFGALAPKKRAKKAGSGKAKKTARKGKTGGAFGS